ncbi:MAG: DUF1998 domain-containing protein [Armatimonadota bacterium]|nr:DUF1998 domain-containing protein [Armatimonadota bacterium]
MGRQQVRQSQFLITYGPGALLESIHGPRMILHPDCGYFPDRVDPQEREISAGRLAAMLDGRVYRLPGVHDPPWPTRPFPKWAICTEHSILYARDCPECGPGGRGKRRVQAVRFLMACSRGHLDEVSWHSLIHGRGSQCQHRDWFHWFGGVSRIRDLRVRCPLCGADASLARLYEGRWPCSGRFPERERPEDPPTRTGCDHHAVLVQRQASNLYVPDIEAIFTLPPAHTRLHQLLQIPAIMAVLQSLDAPVPGREESWLKDFTGRLQRLATRQPRLWDAVENIRRAASDDPRRVIRACLELLEPPPGSREELLHAEMQALLSAATHGAAWDPDAGFEITPQRAGAADGPGVRLRAVPIPRLRVLMVKRGYFRMVDPQRSATRVDVSWRDAGGTKWYPGLDYPGEGILITLDSDAHPGLRHPPLQGNAAREWNRARTDRRYDELVCTPAHVELHPVFVWWHTLSHLLIRAIAIHSGYGAASIRERVYLREESEGATGALVLYTAQPGTDASMGGLVALAPRFQEIVDLAVDAMLYCSNGSLCDERRFSAGSTSGASCYACTVLPETSCEHRNLWLDRQILLENA